MISVTCFAAEELELDIFIYLCIADDVHAATPDAAQRPAKRRRKGDAKKPGGASKEEEFGVTRGIDFKGVYTVINYDLPTSCQGYVHRVGRTGRGGQEGAALTLFTPQDELFR